MTDAITIDRDGEIVTVSRQQFISKSTMMLRDFGYAKLSRDAVDDAVRWLESNDGDGETVIHAVLRPYVVFPQPGHE